eukprot:CAMPEP_0181346124 /NCGR_PEP_ID=MMETSP1101-20121128/33149_1 /TAXON_ID=46948 /ORGANISM="Rhodomonas abbreviata, Strain Caron Lab Isolate" /LENGTH=263 /DNA_ID=CAMNT_0023458193 /DNA_START=345 /DNA_END=1133 /DNA_ORIENTATION=-
MEHGSSLRSSRCQASSVLRIALVALSLGICVWRVTLGTSTDDGLKLGKASLGQLSADHAASQGSRSEDPSKKESLERDMLKLASLQESGPKAMSQPEMESHEIAVKKAEEAVSKGYKSMHEVQEHFKKEVEAGNKAFHPLPKFDGTAKGKPTVAGWQPLKEDRKLKPTAKPNPYPKRQYPKRAFWGWGAFGPTITQPPGQVTSTSGSSPSPPSSAQASMTQASNAAAHNHQASQHDEESRAQTPHSENSETEGDVTPPPPPPP